MTFNDEDLEEWTENENRCGKMAAVDRALKKFLVALEERLFDAVLANDKIEPHDIERHLCALLNNTVLVHKTKEELAEMVAAHFQDVWKKQIARHELKLNTLPDDEANHVDRLVQKALMDELVEKVEFREVMA